MLKTNLQLFGEGGGDGGASVGSSDAVSAPVKEAQTGVKEADAALQDYRQYKKTGKLPAIMTGKQTAERPASAEAKPDDQPAVRDYDKEFEQLIGGEFKDAYGKRVQSIVQDRLKNAKGAEESLQKLQPLLEVLYEQYGVEAGDVDGLLKSLTDDDSLYEEEALQKGVPVDILKQMKANEYQLKQLQAQAEYRAQEEERRHVQEARMQAQAEIRKVYPSFDINAELDDPVKGRTYKALMESGTNLKTAYEMINKDQLQPQMASAVAQKTAENLARSIQAGSSRPMENGMIGGVGQAPLSDDPRLWSKERMAAVKRAAYAGKEIVI